MTTLHGRLDLPDLAVMMRAFPDLPLVSISKAQRTPMPWANWYETILHGLPRDLHRFGEGNGGYLAFLGRISPERGLTEPSPSPAASACRCRSPPRSTRSIAPITRPRSCRG